MTVTQVSALSLGGILTGYTYVVTISSHLHSLLPPWDNDAIAAYPKFQKRYRFMIYFLGWAGASYRSTTYKSISTADGSKISDVAKPADKP